MSTWTSATDAVALRKTSSVVRHAVVGVVRLGRLLRFLVDLTLNWPMKSVGNVALRTAYARAGAGLDVSWISWSRHAPDPMQTLA